MLLNLVCLFTLTTKTNTANTVMSHSCTAPQIATTPSLHLVRCSVVKSSNFVNNCNPNLVGALEIALNYVLVHSAQLSPMDANGISQVIHVNLIIICIQVERASLQLRRKFGYTSILA